MGPSSLRAFSTPLQALAPDASSISLIIGGGAAIAGLGAALIATDPQKRFVSRIVALSHSRPPMKCSRLNYDALQLLFVGELSRWLRLVEMRLRL